MKFTSSSRQVPVLLANSTPPTIPTVNGQTIDSAVELYLSYRAMKGSTSQSLADMKRYLEDFRVWAGSRGIDSLADLDADVLRMYQRFIFDYRKKDGQPLATASKLAKLVPLRTWLRWVSAKLSKPLLAEEIELPAAEQSLPRRLLSAIEIDKVMACPRVNTPVGLRDRAILELLYATGIRRMELAQLELTDVDLDRGLLRIRNGKGRRDRRIPMGPRARFWLVAYIERGRPELGPDSISLSLFLTKNGTRLNLTWLSSVVSGYVRQSGVDEPGSCHLFRHSMATLMLDGGADIRYIQAMLGHAQLSTTQIYTHVSTARLEEVYLTTHPGARDFAIGSSLPASFSGRA